MRSATAGGRYPKDLTHQQIFQMLAALRIIRKNQQFNRRGQNEQDPDEGFLNFRPFLFRPGEKQRTQKSRRAGRGLHPPTSRFEAERVRGCHAQPAT
jgi:hypothetical protein